MKNLILLSLIVVAPLAEAQEVPARQRHFNLNKNTALGGFDPVSYLDGKPLEGSDEFTVQHKGVTYLFSSSANATKFKSNPGKYEPAYGGWCAYAMGATGEKVKVDPETYKIIAGKVYLFYNFWGNNTLHDWNEDEQKLKEAADRNWRKWLESPASRE